MASLPGSPARVGRLPAPPALSPRAAAAGLASALLLACSPDPDGAEAPGAAELIALPVPAAHARGEALFHEHCASCHGPAATGTQLGPPLVHRVYEPSHHADAAFLLAVQRGVRAHHWRFGDMPPQPQVTPAHADTITAYVRWLQRQAGIE